MKKLAKMAMGMALAGAGFLSPTKVTAQGFGTPERIETQKPQNNQTTGQNQQGTQQKAENFEFGFGDENMDVPMEQGLSGMTGEMQSREEFILGYNGIRNRKVSDRDRLSKDRYKRQVREQVKIVDHKNTGPSAEYTDYSLDKMTLDPQEGVVYVYYHSSHRGSSAPVQKRTFSRQNYRTDYRGRGGYESVYVIGYKDIGEKGIDKNDPVVSRTLVIATPEADKQNNRTLDKVSVMHWEATKSQEINIGTLYTDNKGDVVFPSWDQAANQTARIIYKDGKDVEKMFTSIADVAGQQGGMPAKMADQISEMVNLPDGAPQQKTKSPGVK